LEGEGRNEESGKKMKMEQKKGNEIRKGENKLETLERSKEQQKQD
jgi:hypothetical protein